MVFDSCSENTLVIVGSDFLFTVIGNTLPQERGNVVRLYRKDCSPDDLIIKGFQVAWLFEHDVCCALNLLDSPCVAETECFRDWTVAFCKNNQNLMEVFRVDPVREFLGGFHIRDFQESIIMHAVSDFFLLQLTGKKVVAVHVELQTERGPCGDTQIAEPKFFVNEIEIIVKTFALVKLKECFPCGFIMQSLLIPHLRWGNRQSRSGAWSIKNSYAIMILVSQAISKA